MKKKTLETIKVKALGGDPCTKLPQSKIPDS